MTLSLKNICSVYLRLSLSHASKYLPSEKSISRLGILNAMVS